LEPVFAKVGLLGEPAIRFLNTEPLRKLMTVLGLPVTCDLIDRGKRAGLHFERTLDETAPVRIGTSYPLQLDG